MGLSLVVRMQVDSQFCILLLSSQSIMFWYFSLPVLLVLEPNLVCHDKLIYAFSEITPAELWWWLSW